MKKKLKNQIMAANPWWDYSGLLTIMEIWLRESSYKHRTVGNLVRSDKTSKEMLVAAELIKRIKAEEYDKPNKVFKSKNGDVAKDFMGMGLPSFSYNKDADKQLKATVEYLMLIMKRHLLKWWD